MSIVIFGDLFSFPAGGAATNRVHCYAKGFLENNNDVSVVCFLSTYNGNHNGQVDGIKYYYPWEEKERSKYFLVRSWKKIKKYIDSYYLLRKINKADKIVAINCWTNLLSTHLFAWLLSKLVNAKLVIEASEHPLRLHQDNKWKKMQGAAKLYIESRFCDGILCISRYLVDFYKVRGVSERRLFLVPSTVDPSAFTRATNKPVPGSYIGYFGSLTFKRDNVDMLINAFADFSKTYPSPQLILGGFCTEGEKKQIVELLGKLNLQCRTKILDVLSRNEILEYITNADILVMTRSKDLESQASYPSKLTEFLATGKPVISVNVGEISDFVQDNENIFLVEPGNVQQLAEKLKFVYQNYDHALKVAKKGTELTKGIFNYDYQAKKIISFIESLN